MVAELQERHNATVVVHEDEHSDSRKGTGHADWRPERSGAGLVAGPWTGSQASQEAGQMI